MRAKVSKMQNDYNDGTKNLAQVETEINQRIKGLEKTFESLRGLDPSQVSIDEVTRQIKDLKRKRDNPKTAYKDSITFSNEKARLSENFRKAKEKNESLQEELKDRLERSKKQRSAELEQAEQEYRARVENINALHKAATEKTEEELKEAVSRAAQLEEEHREKQKVLTKAKATAESAAEGQAEPAATGLSMKTISADEYDKYASLWMTDIATTMKTMGFEGEIAQRLSEMIKVKADSYLNWLAELEQKKKDPVSSPVDGAAAPTPKVQPVATMQADAAGAAAGQPSQPQQPHGQQNSNSYASKYDGCDDDTQVSKLQRLS